MLLTKDNYFSLEANRHYMSVSQFKSFVPSFGGCEAAAVAELNGEYEREPSNAMIEGSYIHAWNEGALEEFKANNPDLYSSRGKTAGQLKVNFQHCNKMIEVLENDPLVMKALAGQKEMIFTTELFGIEWKCMIDSYQDKLFTDLKCMKSMSDKFWNVEHNCYENFIQHYGYDFQMSVYAEIERLAIGRVCWIIPHMVIVTKEDPPDHDILYFDYDAIESGLMIVEKHIERVKAVKSGDVEPERCEKCEYCRATKKIKTVKHYLELALY